jgi:hypothetical protein
MAQTLAALHPDRTKRPRPHRPALVATPGAGEWISRVSSPATNRSGRTLKKGAENLANSRAALQISLMNPVSQQPVPNFCATVSRRMQKGDVPTGSTRVASPIETGTATSPMQRERQRRRVTALRSRAARQSWKRTIALPSLIGRLPKQRAAPVNPAGSARSVSNSCCCR